jgi:hypothetical protein
MMFGLGGAARWYGPSFTWGSASVFNIFQAENPFGSDGRGAFPGYRIALFRAFKNRNAFCGNINGFRWLDYNDSESRDIVNQCATCTTDKVATIFDKWGNQELSGIAGRNPSSLVMLSDGVSTFEDLRNKVNHLLRRGLLHQASCGQFPSLWTVSDRSTMATADWSMEQIEGMVRGVG